MVSMSGGGWSYNRFDNYEQQLSEKKAKPDFLDVDKDGNEKESFKKALKDKSKKDDCECKEEVEQVDEGSCGGTGYQKGGKVKGYQKGGKIVKEDVLEYMLEHDMANNVVSAEVLFNHISDEFLEAIEEDIMEVYKGKHGQSEKEYQDGRSNAGK